MNIADFTTDANTLEQQIADVRAYAAANSKVRGWDFIAPLTDEQLGEVIGKRKNTRGAINAAFAYIKPLHEARPDQAIDTGTVAATIANEQTVEVAADTDKAAERRARRTAQQKARREAARAAK